MNRLSLYPMLFKLKGKGEFCSENHKFKANFKLLYCTENIRIIVTISDLVVPDTKWTLCGHLEDSRSIKCNDLLFLSNKFSTNSIGKLELSPNSEIVIGKEWQLQIREASFTLVDYFDGDAVLVNDGWDIVIANGKETLENASYLNRFWNIKWEGMSLKLCKNRKSNKQYLNKALIIIRLLSLASGKEVSFDRQIYRYENSDSLEVWRKMSGGGYTSIGPIIPGSLVKRYLEEVLPNFESWNEKDRELLRIANDYINSSGTGFIDDRILRIMQTWELLANEWSDEGDELAAPLKELKKELKEVCSEWRKRYPDEDPDGFWGTRIRDSLYWKKAVRKMESLAASINLDIEKIGINFKELIDIRDSVVHTGIMNSNYKINNGKSPIDLLLAAQFGLRLLLLKKLGYSGQIDTKNKDNRSTIVSISDYFEG